MNPVHFENRVPLDYPDHTICILGMGFVGLTLATVMAGVGFRVIGIEIRDELLSKLQSGTPDFFEPGLSAQLKKTIADGMLEFHKTIPDHSKATVYIITVGTPIDEERKINLTSIQNISHDIASRLKDGDLVLLRSTVKLGTTRSVVLPILEKSGKKLQLAFCPERTIEGQAMSELHYLPQVIGTDSLVTGMRAAQLFQFLTPTTLRVSDFETAEMIKLIDNTRRDVIFAFSNEVAQICSAAGLRADEVINVGRFGYSRTDLPVPGPVGGPCLSKDPHILIQSMIDLYGITPEITSAARKVNERQPMEVVTFLKEFLHKNPNFPSNLTISLLGIAFKGSPPTDDLRGTTAKPILEVLQKAFPQAEFWGYDPVVPSGRLREFGLNPKQDLQSATTGAHLVLILNNHALFSNMRIESIALEMARPGIIYDFWNSFSRKNIHLPPGVDYIALGSHQRPIRGDALSR